MKRSAIYRFLRMIVLTFSTFSLMSFTVVIDAGHGGHDAGAIGLVKGVKEKDLNLTVAKRLATKIQQHHPDYYRSCKGSSQGYSIPEGQDDRSGIQSTFKRCISSRP